MFPAFTDFSLPRPDVEAQFRQLELPTSEAEELFDILDEDKTGELDIKTFVEGSRTSSAHS